MINAMSAIIHPTRRAALLKTAESAPKTQAKVSLNEVENGGQMRASGVAREVCGSTLAEQSAATASVEVAGSGGAGTRHLAALLKL